MLVGPSAYLMEPVGAAQDITWQQVQNTRVGEPQLIDRTHDPLVHLVVVRAKDHVVGLNLVYDEPKT